MSTHDCSEDDLDIGRNLANAVDFEDPLQAAEQWFLETGRRLQEEAVQQASGQDMTSQGHAEDSISVTSPLYPKNGQGSTQGVYPTPPDGFVASVNAPTLSTIGQEPNVDVPALDGTQPHSPDRTYTENVAVDSREDDENLFGDMDEEMLGNPDITDADFNFFDQGSVVRHSVSRHSSLETRLLRPEDTIPSSQGSPEYRAEEITTTQLEDQVLSDFTMSGDDRVALTSNDGQGRNSSLSNTARSPPGVIESHVPWAPPDTPPLSPVLVRSRLTNDGRGPIKTSSQDREYAPVGFQASARTSRSKYGTGGKFDVNFKAGENSMLSSGAKRSISLHDYEHLAKKTADYQTVLRLRRPVTAHTPASNSDDSDSEVADLQVMDDTISLSRVGQASPGKSQPESYGVQRLGRRQDMGHLLQVTQDVVKEASDRPDRSLQSRGLGYFELNTSSRSVPDLDLWSMFDLDGNDLIAVAQLLSTHAAVSELLSPHDPHCTLFRHETREPAHGLISAIGMSSLSLNDLTTMNNPAPVTDATQKHDVRPGGRRLMLPISTTLFDQDLFPLVAPFIRTKRAEAVWDVSPLAFQFWDVLGLESLHLPKNMIAEAVMVGTEDVRADCTLFLKDLQYHYESAKLGTFTLGNRILAKPSNPSPGSSDDNRPLTLLVLLALKDACIDLARKMNQRSKRDEPSRHVVFLFDPFASRAMAKYLCACFQTMLKDLNVTPAMASLQIIPLGLATDAREHSWSRSSSTLNRLALALYDSLTSDERPPKETPWRGFAAKSFTLAASIPRKINFALSEHPPINLLTEAQILHVACAISDDAQWLVIAWTDFCGNHQDNISFSLRKTGMDAIMTAVKGYMLDLLTPKTTWRLMVACVGYSDVSQRRYWTDLASYNVAVTIMEVSLSTPLQICPTSDAVEQAPTVPTTPAIPQGTTLTPASTPQASAAAFSPETPTPGAEHQVATAATLEPPLGDPETQLIDIRDDSFALVVPFSTTRPPRNPSGHSPLARRAPLASGLLLKRGEGQPGVRIPSLGIDVVEIVQPKITGGRPNWLMPRAPDLVLREVLSWYRGLAVLGRLRGVRGCEKGEVPWHIGVAVAAARALEGFV